MCCRRKSPNHRFPAKNPIFEFSSELDAAHKKLREKISNYDERHQEECFKLLSTWGGQIADNPSGNSKINQKSDEAKTSKISPEVTTSSSNCADECEVTATV